MGQTTPNMSIYIPAAGETNYDQSFAAGMFNIDQHDHTGGPTKGVPITTGGIADGSVTYAKLNPNVVDTTTGLGTHGGGLANQITTTGTLLALAGLAGNGLISKNGTVLAGRTVMGTANQVAVTNGDGIAGNPTIALTNPIYTNISFDAGTTTLDNYSFGTFVPTLLFGGGNSGMTGAFRGKYWRIGAVVVFSIVIILTNKGVSTGNATLAGLPFNFANDTYVNIFSGNSLINTYPASVTAVTYTSVPNSTTINVVGTGPATRVQFIDTNFSNTSEVIISGTYWLA